MEKAILKTLIYADIFDYPLKGYEVFKWLVKEETTLLKVERALQRLIKKKKIQFFKDYFFLLGKKRLVLKREGHEKYSKSLFRKAYIFANILRVVPWIKLVGISGGLALNDADKKDDIDLFLITSGKRLWISRILAIFLLNIFGVRRKVGMKKLNVKKKICLNTILDAEHLEQRYKDLFVAHEVLQMKVLWQREGVYSKFLYDNDWVFKFLPNWTSRIKYLKTRVDEGSKIIDQLEDFAMQFQIKIMQPPKGLERIEDGGLYFYPSDYREKIKRLY